MIEEKDITKQQDATAQEGPSLSELISQQATEEDAPMGSNVKLKDILGGDFLSARIVRSQIWLILEIVLLLIIYISNRYTCQRYALEIDKLTVQLEDAKFRALSSCSDLTRNTREGQVLQMLSECGDSLLHSPDKPPFIITISKDE